MTRPRTRTRRLQLQPGQTLKLQNGTELILVRMDPPTYQLKPARQPRPRETPQQKITLMAQRQAQTWKKQTIQPPP